MTTSREVAFGVLCACRRRSAWVDAELKKELAQAGLDSRDAALASRLVYGVMQNQLLLDYYLSRFVSRPLEKMERRTLDILRLGAYQLLMMDKIPAMAAVNESVELAKENLLGLKTAGFINAVLRNLDRSRGKLPPLPADPMERLSIQYSHPLWLVQMLADRVGADEVEPLLRAHNDPPPITAQVNTLRVTPRALTQRLGEEGVRVGVHGREDCLELEGTGDLERLTTFQEGLFYIQDPAARQAVLAAAPRPGEKVLDLCAAPGGKSFAAAIAMENKGHILSRDLYPRKVRELSKAARRLGLSCIEAVVADATEAVEEQFDLVMADVPCSGLGIIRKKPDIRYKDPAGFGELETIQAAILDRAGSAVAPGGRLLYATCTLRREENEDQVDRFLEKRKDFTLSTLETLWPHREGTDGFFYALLERR